MKIIILYLLSSIFIGQPVNWALGPSLSPDGQFVAFSYHGDLWVAPSSGGLAVRITTTEGFEGLPVWSRDGKWIAFVSDASGSSEIYVIPSDGSAPPGRITYHPASEYPLMFDDSGEYIYFSSSMYDFSGGVYKISIDGGNPVKVFDFVVNELFEIDQNRFLLERGNELWYRKGYRGPANREIWMYDLCKGEFVRLTKNDLRDSKPMYSRKTGKVYFLSNRSNNGITNLFSMNLDGSDVTQLTRFEEEINWASISWDGSKIVLESLGKLYIYDVLKDSLFAPDIRVVDDFDPRSVVKMKIEGNITDFAISPKGDQLAFVALGEIFVMCIDSSSVDYGKVKKITSTPAPEKDVFWDPKGEFLYYTTLRNGSYDIYRITPQGSEPFYKNFSFREELIVRGAGTEKEPVVSPDGAKILFKRDKGKIFVKDLKSGKEFRVGSHNDVLWVSWSPDSRWIAYSRTELGPREDVYVVRAVEGAVPVNITDHPNDDYKPMWTKDGRRLFFASRNYEGDWWIKYMYLRDKEHRERDVYLHNLKEADTLSHTVEIKFDGLRERTVTVYRFRAYYNFYTISPNGLYIAVQAEDLNGNDLWIVDHEGKNPRRITTGGLSPKRIEFTPDGNELVFLSGDGKLYKVNVKQGNYMEIKVNEEVSYTYYDLYSNLFFEGWWMLKDGFYDGNMHGADWEKQRERYLRFIPYVKTYGEFNNLVYRMLGELNASHLGIWQERTGRTENFGDLGIVIDGSYEGDGVKVEKVILNSPAHFSGLKAGDVIVSVDGERVNGKKQLSYYLLDKTSKEVVLEVLRDRKGKRTEKIKIKSVSYWEVRDLIYKEWVLANRKVVDSLSNGKFAYIHIRGMGEWNLREFEKDIYENRNKEGLVLDIRYNGGGHIHDELLNFLRRTKYLVEKERDGEYEYNSLFRWDKPVVLLINEHCFSDAEIFPAGFKKLKLGKVVGVPTFGGVIGTNNYTLFDGKTVFRQPSEGWYFDIGEPSLENTPVEPDFYIENEIWQDNKSLDNQILKTIEVLVEMVED